MVPVSCVALHWVAHFCKFRANFMYLNTSFFSCCSFNFAINYQLPIPSLFRTRCVVVFVFPWGKNPRLLTNIANWNCSYLLEIGVVMWLTRRVFLPSQLNEKGGEDRDHYGNNWRVAHRHWLYHRFCTSSRRLVSSSWLLAMVWWVEWWLLSDWGQLQAWRIYSWSCIVVPLKINACLLDAHSAVVMMSFFIKFSCFFRLSSKRSL